MTRCVASELATTLHGPAWAAEHWAYAGLLCTRMYQLSNLEVPSRKETGRMDNLGSLIPPRSFLTIITSL
jgi:hypothetical protein